MVQDIMAHGMGVYNYHIVVIVARENCILLENTIRDAHTNSINNSEVSQ